jgi:hypothetical protein
MDPQYLGMKSIVDFPATRLFAVLHGNKNWWDVREGRKGWEGCHANLCHAMPCHGRLKGCARGNNGVDCSVDYIVPKETREVHLNGVRGAESNLFRQILFPFLFLASLP